uniref:Uncharacterized protein n=1 Tax=Setaria italica TaxID=4555 RepID=K3XW65_SETIT
MTGHAVKNLLVLSNILLVCCSCTRETPRVHLEALDQIQQVPVRRPAFLHGGLRLRRERPRPPPPLLPLVPSVQDAPHRLLDHISPHHDLLLVHPVHQRLHHPDVHADPQHLHGELGVQELVREVRPRHHRQPGRDRLHGRVPPAVRDEAAHGRVRQDQHLRRPTPDEQAAPGDAPLELAVARRLQPEPELDDLLRFRLRDAPEADVHDGPGLLAVEPPEALVGADGGGVASRRQRRFALVEKRHRADGPHLHTPCLSVAGDVLRLHLQEAVGDDAVGLGQRLLDVVRELLKPGRPTEEPRSLSPRHLDPFLQPGHDDRLVVVGDAVVRVVPLDVVLAQEAEGAHAEEAEPRDGEARRELLGPRVAEVRHDAGRVRRAGGVEVALERLAEARQGAEVVGPEIRRHLFDVVSAVGEPFRGEVERELHEPDRQAGLPGEVHGRADAPGIGRRDDDADERAVGGQEQSRVDRRDQVALEHERDEHEVRLDVGAAAGIARRSPAIREVFDCHLAASEAVVGESGVVADEFRCLKKGTGFWPRRKLGGRGLGGNEGSKA